VSTSHRSAPSGVAVPSGVQRSGEKPRRYQASPLPKQSRLPRRAVGGGEERARRLRAVKAGPLRTTTSDVAQSNGERAFPVRHAIRPRRGDIDVQVWPRCRCRENAIGHDPLAGRLRRASRPAPAGATFHERRHPGHPGHRSGPNDFDNNPPERDSPDRAKPGIPDCVILGAWPCTPVLPSRFAPTTRIR